MLLTMHLAPSETNNYAARRAAIKADAEFFALREGRRFAQIVGSDGRILDVVEVR